MLSIRKDSAKPHDKKNYYSIRNTMTSEKN